MSIARNDAGNPLYSSSKNYVNEDTSFVAGDSPKVLTPSTTLTATGVKTRNGNRGYIKVDGVGDLLVEISHNGSDYNTQFTLKNGDSFDLTGLEVNKIRFTHSGTDTAYRVQVW